MTAIRDLDDIPGAAGERAAAGGTPAFVAN